MGFMDWSVQKRIKIVNVCLSGMIVTIAILQIVFGGHGVMEMLVPLFLG